jgi:hypothetical protein
VKELLEEKKRERRNKDGRRTKTLARRNEDP